MFRGGTKASIIVSVDQAWSAKQAPECVSRNAFNTHARPPTPPSGVSISLTDLGASVHGSSRVSTPPLLSEAVGCHKIHADQHHRLELGTLYVGGQNQKELCRTVARSRSFDACSACATASWVAEHGAFAGTYEEQSRSQSRFGRHRPRIRIPFCKCT